MSFIEHELLNFLTTEHLYAVASGSDTIVLYDETETIKSEDTLQAEIETLSFNWVSSPYFARFNALAYRTISTSLIMMLIDHENIHERTTFSSQIDFEFLVSSVSLFDAEMYY